MAHKIAVMFSGGLDSVMATHLLKAQGLDVVALHFVLPFYSGLNLPHTQIKNYAAALDVPLQIVEEGEEFLTVMRNPQYGGFGKNANPCIDCRIHRLKKAARIMEEMNAVCLATGEVAGQRPMSQKMPMLHRVEKLAGLRGKLLRPLCAKLLPPTDAENAGIINREKLLNISGRSRARQLAYATEHGLIHGAPAGGCLLTNIETGARFMDLQKHNPDFPLADFKLLAYGRHFRLSENSRVIVSRSGNENECMEKIAAQYSNNSEVIKMYLRDTTGPVALCIGTSAKDDLQFCAAAVVRFSKMRNAQSAAVNVYINDTLTNTIEAPPADEILIDKYRIKGSSVV